MENANMWKTASAKEISMLTEDQFRHHMPRIIMHQDRRALAMTLLSQYKASIDPMSYATLRSFPFLIGAGSSMLMVGLPQNWWQWAGLIAIATTCFASFYIDQKTTESMFRNELSNFKSQSIRFFVNYFVDREIHGESQLDEEIEDKILSRQF